MSAERGYLYSELFPDPAERPHAPAERHEMTYATIRDLAKTNRQRVEELLALSPGYDPFYCGVPSRERAGRWFGDLWERYSFPRGLHLRRAHYLLVSQDPPPMLPEREGIPPAPYQNTFADWDFLNSAASNARYLGYVQADAFEDNRSDQPRLFASPARLLSSPSWFVSDVEDDDAEPPWTLPSLDVLDAAQALPTFTAAMPMPLVIGYDFRLEDAQPFTLEVWIEKSTVTDVLAPLCEEYGVNLVVGVGYLSITRIAQMLRRVASLGKPARILYVSDHDPAGEGMPIQVARQAEFWLPTYAPDADVKLTSIVLTPQQIAAYDLPKVPIKESVTAKTAFEDRHGSGATELDALEALHPGELRKIVRQAIEPYIDRALRRRVEAAGSEARAAVRAAWDALLEDEEEQLEEISDEIEEILDTYRDELASMGERLEADLASFSGRLNDVWQALREKRNQLSVDLPERPTSDLEPPDSESEWLYDSARDYDEQMAAYQARRPGKASVASTSTAVCLICGRTFPIARKSNTLCSTACRQKKFVADRAEQRRQPERPCEICGVVFTPRKASSQACSDPCRAKITRKPQAKQRAERAAS